MPSGIILALVNNKGGVAKSTTAVNVAARLAEKGPVLLVDLDSQASASLSLGAPRDDLSPSAADVILAGESLGAVIRETPVPGLDLVTGSPELINADLELADVRGREGRLASGLNPARRKYTFTVIDCPPSLSLLTVNALVACDGFLVPVNPHYLALEGLVALTGAVETIRERIGRSGELLGILFTMVDSRPRASAEIREIIREHYGRKVLRAEIPLTTRIAEAPSFWRTIYEHAPRSKGAESYRAAADEIRRRAIRNYGRP
jgi:chromosome partitioning protein